MQRQIFIKFEASLNLTDDRPVTCVTML